MDIPISFPVNVQESDKLLVIKSKIKDKVNIPTNEQRLISNRDVQELLEDENQSTIILLYLVV